MRIGIVKIGEIDKILLQIEKWTSRKGTEIARIREKLYSVLKFIHEGKYIVFHDIRKGRRKKEVYDGIMVIIVMN